MFEAFQEVMHQVSLLPLVVILVMYQRNRMVTSVHWLIAAALSVSWFADSILSLIIRQGARFELFIPHLFTIPQLGLMLLALVSKITPMWFLFMGLILLTVTTLIGGDYLTIQIAGGLVVVWYAVRANLGVIGIGIFIYFGLGSLFWAVYMLDFPDGLRPWWFLYQYSRLAGIILITLGMVRYKPRLKVVRDAVV